MGLITQKYAKFSRKEMKQLYEMDMKRCNTCEEVLSLALFHKKKLTRAMKYPYRSSCRLCEIETKRKVRENNLVRICRFCKKEGTGLNGKKMFMSNKDSNKLKSVCLECSELEEQRIVDQRRRYELDKNYGMSLDDYNEMYEDQDGRCMICDRPERENKLLAVDHCHTTGNVRGLLCQNCNLGIGLLEDNIKFLKGAIKYLGGVSSDS